MPSCLTLREKEGLAEIILQWRILESLVPLGIWVGTSRGELTYASPSLLSLLGLDEKDSLSFADLESNPPEAPSPELQLWLAALQAGRCEEYDFSFTDAKGNRHHVLRKGLPVLDAEGNLAGWIGLHCDRTGLHQKAEGRREAHRHFEGLARHIHDAIIVQDGFGGILFANEAAAGLLGMPSVEALHGAADDCLEANVAFFAENGESFPPENLPYRLALRGELPGPTTLRIENRGTGESSWQKLQVSTVPDDRGGVNMVVTTIYDISAQKAAEEELKTAHETLALIYENVSDLIILLSVEADGEYRFRQINRPELQPGSPGREETVGNSLSEVLPEPYLSFYRAKCAEVQEKKEPLAFEYQINKGGGSRTVEAKYTPIFNSRGICTHILIVARDIQERKQNEAKIRILNDELGRRVRELQTIFDTAPVGLILIKDAESRYQKLNPVMSRLLEMDTDTDSEPGGGTASPAYSIWRRGRELGPEETPMGRCMATAAPVRDEELEIRFSHGRVRYLVGSAAPVFDEKGKVRGAIGAFLDVSEKKKQEETLKRNEGKLLQAQKMEAIGQLAGGVAHDFNNLLTAINGYADLLLHELPHDENKRMYSMEIKKSGERAAALTQQLLAYSRQQILSPRKMDLNTVVEDMVKLLGRLIGKEINLVTLTPERPTYVNADPGQIEQVVLNLAVNARDAMPDGGELLIKVTCEQRLMPDSRANTPSRQQYGVLWVSDSGHGMDEGIKARLFEPFFTTKELGKGTGLGLSVVEGIVKQSGGFIELQSAPGEGTLFKVYLPAAETLSEKPSRRDGERITEKLPVTGKGTLLLVEDEDMVRNFVAKVLSVGGYDVLTASGAAEALLVSERHAGPIDVLITDVVMPQMTGPKLAEILTQQRGGIQVVFMSGYTDDSIAKHGLFQSGSHFLQKPFAPKTILRKLQEILKTGSIAPT